MKTLARRKSVFNKWVIPGDCLEMADAESKLRAEISHLEVFKYFVYLPKLVELTPLQKPTY